MPITETQARENLKRLLDDFDKLTPDERKTMSEASVVRQFVDRLLEEVLDWPIKDPQRYKYEMNTQAGRPDLTLFPESGGVIFIEAKKLGVIKELEQSRHTIQGVITPGQMALPGMAVDRTAEEQQAINYAFANGGTWAILTNFERLRLFNARRDWLVLSFERPGAYLTEFDQLWQLSYENVLKGSLDALSNQRYARDIDSAYLDFVNEWRLKLAQDILEHPKQNRWAFDENGAVKLPDLRAVVQRYLDRMVIARFAEDWLVIPPGTLRQIHELRQSNRYTFPLDQQLDQFFRRFDEEHNSALFAYGLVDEASFSDDVLAPLINKLYEVRYRAMPADILGNTYEQYLGKALAVTNGTVTTRDNLETRKKQGSYYTPQVIVQYIVDNSLGRYLYGTENGQPDGKPLAGESRKTAAEIRDLKVLDSACGSGSFLIYAYKVLADFYESELKRLTADYDEQVRQMAANFDKISLDDRIAAERVQQEQERLRDYPRIILETHLYGVDLDPAAAEIATVNLIMRAMEGRHHEKLLPLILNQNVKVGNGLVGFRTSPPAPLSASREGEEDYRLQLATLRRLRGDVIRVWEGDAHTTALQQLETQTAALAAHLNEHLAPHFTDLARVRPFHWGVEFPEVFYNDDGTLKDNPGFTIIFGNPPWEILKPDLREFYAQFDERIESRLNRTQAETRIAELDAEDPRRREEFERINASVGETTSYLRANGDYTRQGRGDPATHKLFLERMYGLLQNGGRLGYVVPSGIYTDLGTKDLREMLLNEGSIQYIYSFSNERFFFPGVDHRFKFCMLGAYKGTQSDGFWAAFRFNPRVAVAPDDLPAFLSNENNLIYVGRASLERFSPDSLSVMEFQSKQDYEAAEKIYADWPLLGENPHPPAPSPSIGEGESDPAFVPHLYEVERGLGGEDIPYAQTYTDTQLWDALKPLARQMRHEPTPAEEALWEQIRNRKIHGLKFRRQHPIDRFIVDFYCAEAHLVVEVDGEIHDYTPDEDALRQAFLESRGLRVVRFRNEDVLQGMDNVLEQIEAVVNTPHPPSPSPLHREGEQSPHTALKSPLQAVERGFRGEDLTWTLQFAREFDMANDAHLFNEHQNGLPLYEGKMIHQFNADFAEPRYWIDEAKGTESLAGTSAANWFKGYRFAFREVASTTNERTCIATVLPPNTFAGHTLWVGVAPDEQILLYYVGIINSFCIDWLVRFKGGTHVTLFLMKSLPVPRLTAGHPAFDAIVPRAARLTCTRPEFAGLWEDVMGEKWDAKKGATDPAERQQLRDEIDALVAHLYGLTREEYDHILGTFPLVFPDSDEGRARRAATLAAYDAAG
ncbi:MAG: DUF559 domain-containing protein [Anaerolineae bacterium]